MKKKFSGLTTSQVEKSREKCGSNQIPKKPPETFWDKIKESLQDKIILLLFAIAGVEFVLFLFGLEKIYGPVGIVVAIIIVAVVSACTEMSMAKKFDELEADSDKESCKVYRNGAIEVILRDELVVGDVVILESGDKIFADGVLIDGKIEVDNSALNGESDPCKKQPTTPAFESGEVNENPERPKITGETFVDGSSLFRGTTVVSGSGVMEVRWVGTSTMMGQMAADEDEEEVPSPLKRKLSKLADQISMFGYIGASAAVLLYFVHFVILAGGFSEYFALGGTHILKDFLEAVSVALVVVACAVPEGLPLMIAIVLMKNTSTMLKHNVLVLKPIGIETAGSLNVLCSDKTGTITKGELEVVEFFDGTATAQDVKEMAKNNKFLQISIARNTTALFDKNHNIVGGNPTDHALVKLLGEEAFTSVKEDENYPVMQMQEFLSANKFSQAYIGGTINKTVYKGAPEKLLQNSVKAISADGSEVPIDKELIQTEINKLTNKAMRVIAFGYSNSEMVENKLNEDLTFIGFVGIRDDVRPEAIQAIADVQKAGIQVVMITGDCIETAVAISKEAGILDESKGDIAILAKDFDELSDEEAKEIIPRIRTIARALPTTKSRFVKLCQDDDMGLVCGMTGDGVNDTPALRRADVGFAMGGGTDAAKAAGDIIVTDDNFRSIRDAVLYGRTIYHNILKFVKFQLTINVAAVIVSAILPFFGIEEALTVTHLLFVNLCMDSLGALLLGQEPPEERYMTEPPRKRDESIISKNMAVQFIFIGLYLFAAAMLYFKLPFFRDLFPAGVDGDAQFKTGFFAMFMFMAIFNGFNVRTDGFNIFHRIKENKQFISVWSIMLVSTIILCAVGGPIGRVFSCTRFGLAGWVIAITAGLSVIVVDLIRKAIFKTYKN